MVYNSTQLLSLLQVYNRHLEERWKYSQIPLDLPWLVKADDSKIETLIFSADGDMRQAINSLQSAYYGFGYINADHVFKVCDQPHPVAVQNILSCCVEGNIDEAAECIRALYDTGYSSLDIINTISRVKNNYGDIEETLNSDIVIEIGETHMRILDGYNSVIQLTGLVSRLCRISQQ
ncbi:hypothetical protein K501DRAFT_301323 [Backusella circina FSU 941]|nr:hypothetical protein K501DRAFT_301323 [Backusella circina FSU 941]